MTTIIIAIAAALGVTVPDVPSADACNGGLMDCAQDGCNGGWAVDGECAD